MILATEAVNTFINPVEASVLAHQPIQERTYFAAKLTYLAIIVAWIVVPANVVPSLAGLNLEGAAWSYPMTYLIATYLLGFFFALIACGFLGLLFRFVGAASVRSTVVWVQIAFVSFLFVGPSLIRAISGARSLIDIGSSPALPVNWFVVLALTGSSAARPLFNWLAVFTIGLSSVFIWYGIRSLTKGYLTRVHVLLRSGPKPRRGWGGWFGTFVRLLTGRPSGRAAFAFMYSMARGDWQFRRAALPILIQFLIFPVFGIVRGLGLSPFQPGPPTAGHLLPHISGLIGLVICMMLIYSDQHRAAWIFLTIPPDSIHSFVRGIFWALWAALSSVPVLLLPLFVWYWGIGDALLFAAYSVSLGSLYLALELFLVDGLPFANPPAGKASLVGPLVIMALLGALILVSLQWLFIFRSRIVTAGAVLAFAGSAYIIARTSMRYLEVNVIHNLHVIASGRKCSRKSTENLRAREPALENTEAQRKMGSS